MSFAYVLDSYTQYTIAFKVNWCTRRTVYTVQYCRVTISCCSEFLSKHRLCQWIFEFWWLKHSESKHLCFFFAICWLLIIHTILPIHSEVLKCTEMFTCVSKQIPASIFHFATEVFIQVKSQSWYRKQLTKRWILMNIIQLC